MTKNMTIGDFLTASEIKAAKKIWDDDRANFHSRCLSEVIMPNMARINKALGQDNDPDYLAYAVEFVLGSTR